MTECERLIKLGFITEDFLKEEVICDYTVKTELKKTWAIELDLLREFKRVCEKYNLTYYAYAGTLLGAVRHKGFIPWDDDIDVCMPRKDYDLLTKVYADEFKSPYFMQTPHTDKNYAYSFAKIRNINTCFASKTFIENPMNQGIFLDVFPLDYSDSNVALRRKKIEELIKYCSAFMSKDNKIIKNKHTELAAQTTFREDDNIKLYEHIHNIAKSSKEEESQYMVTEVSTMSKLERKLNSKEYFSESVELEFCNTTIKAPKGYKEILSAFYGDYNKFPPIELRGLHHSNIILSTDKNYIKAQKDALAELTTINRGIL